VKVLFLAGGFTPPGGIESFIHSLSPTLAAEEHEVCLVCWGPQSRLLDEIARCGVIVRRQSFRWGCRLSIPDLMLAVRYGMQAVLAHDAVIFTKLPPALLLSSMRRIARRGTCRSFIYVTPYRPKEMWREARPAATTLNAFDSIIVQTPGFADELRDLGYRGLVETIPLIPPKTGSICPLPARDDCIRVGFLGRLVPQKNLAYLLDAMGHLVDGHGTSAPGSWSWELHLFGGGPARQELEAAAAAKGLQTRIHFHGPVPHDSVHAAIDRCHLFAFSSVSEGQCLAALEILSRGRPIVATPVGAFPEFLTTPELGRLAPLDDATQFAAALTQVGSALMQGVLTPQAVQSRFTALFPRVDIVSKYREFLSRTTCAPVIRER
jgi:glycosyltransferase involved in cell wall biosynthesis